MTSQLFGFNINAAESNEGAVLDIVRRTKARSHTVMHGVTMARKVYDVVGQTTGEEPVIVCREDWPDDNWREAKYVDLRGYFDQWRRRGGYWPGAYVYWLNEPVIKHDNKDVEVSNLKSLLRKSIEAMEASAATGVKAVIGNYADASLFEREYIDAGLFDEWARVASQYTNGGHGFIGHHNYSYGLPWIGSAGVPYDQLKQVNPQPPAREAFQETHAWANWLQGRFMWPLLRCDHLKIPRYRFVCTEGVWDRMPSGEREGWITSAEAFWGLGKLRGPLDQRALWAKLYPGMSQAAAGIRQLEGLAGMMAGLPCYGVHLFTLSYNPEWVTFNFLEWIEFVNELAAYAQRAVWTPGKVVPPVTTPESVPKPSDAGTGQRVRNTSSDSYRVRSGPGTNYPQVGGIASKAEVTIYPATKRAGGAYQWVWVEGGSGQPGWAANDGQFTPVVPVFGEPAVLHDVPFQTQRGVGVRNECGEACLTMLANYWLEATGRHGQVMIEDIIASVNNAGGYASLAQVKAVAAGIGLALDVRANSPMTFIEDELDAGRPFIALVERGKLPGTKSYDGFTGAHYVVVTGYGDGFVTLHDPLSLPGGAGVHLKVAFAAFIAAWETTPGNSGRFQALVAPADQWEPVDGDSGDEDPKPPVDPDLYAAVLAQSAKLEHAHNALIVAQQEFALAIAEVNESLRGIIGHS